ncbi:hypothetical protein K438DRAFT_1768658 [Mycena galopus ATCC 62051]|nr:hypothetical protein K438DRAFT_1768658 [Mycena galopus ATCC 62051]
MTKLLGLEAPRAPIGAQGICCHGLRNTTPMVLVANLAPHCSSACILPPVALLTSTAPALTGVALITQKRAEIVAKLAAMKNLALAAVAVLAPAVEHSPRV